MTARTRMRWWALPMLLIAVLTRLGGAQGTLRGQVVDVKSGEPMAAAVTLAIATRTGEIRPDVAVERVPCGADGRFEVAIPDLGSSGFPYVIVRAEQFVSQRVSSQDIDAGRTIVRLERGREIAGVVVDAESGRPVGNARVTTTFESARADARGRFRLRWVSKRDPLALRIRAEGYEMREGSFTPESDGRFRLGIRTAEEIVARVVDGRGRPIRDAVVKARLPFEVAYSALERRSFTARSDERGIAIVRGLPRARPLILRAEKGELVASESPVLLPHPPVEDDAGARPSAVLLLDRGARARIVVRDEEDRPLRNATVQVMPLVEPLPAFSGGTRIDNSQGSVRIVEVDEEGAVELDGLPDQPMTVEARCAGYTTRMRVVNGAQWSAVFRLRRDPRGERTLVWAQSPREAFARAEKERLPLWIALSMRGERANDWMLAHHFHDPEIARAADSLAGAFNYLFAPAPAAVSFEAFARTLLAPGQELICPKEIFLAPDGRVLMDRFYYLSERQLTRMIIRAVRVCNPERAAEVAALRLPWILPGLLVPDETLRDATLEAFVQLVNSGDEHAVALLHRLGPAGIAVADRRAILDGILLETLSFPGSALAPFLDDPHAGVRALALAKLTPVAERDSVVELLAGHLDEKESTVREPLLRALGAEESPLGVSVADAASGRRWRIVEELLATTPADRLWGLDAVLNSGRTEPRNLLLLALAKKDGDAGAARRLLEAASRPGAEAIPGVRALARAFDGLGEDERALAVVALRKSLRSADPLRRECTAEVLASVRHDEVEGWLRRCLDDPEAQVAEAARRSLIARGVSVDG